MEAKGSKEVVKVRAGGRLRIVRRVGRLRGEVKVTEQVGDKVPAFAEVFKPFVEDGHLRLLFTRVAGGKTNVADQEASVRVSFKSGDSGNSVAAKRGRNTRADNVMRVEERRADTEQDTSLEGAGVVVSIVGVVAIENLVVRGAPLNA